MTPEKILLVDDDANILSAYRRTLRTQFKVEVAQGGEAALRLMQSAGPFAVVVSDLRMPGVDGTALLARVRQTAPDTVRVMLTGQADLESAIEAVNEGNIFRFLTKPCRPEALTATLHESLAQYRLVRSERELLEKTLGGSIDLLTDLLGLVSPAAFGRASRIQKLTRLLLPHFGRENAWQLDVTAMLSQIGAVTLPNEIVEKAGRGKALTPQEQELWNSHPQIGHDLVANIPRLDAVAQNIAYQLKQFDGGGPPSGGTRGKEIPLGARLLKVLLDYDALLRSGMDSEEAVGRMSGCHSWYDPRILFLLQSSVVDVREGHTFRLVNVDELTTGMIVKEGITTAQGNVLVGRGQEMTPSLLAKVKNFAHWQPLEQPIGVFAPLSGSRPLKPPDSSQRLAPPNGESPITK